MSDPASLYERDFYAWTQDQAATLRTWPERLRPSALDIEHLAEEIEDLGSAQRNAVQSLIYQILLHLDEFRETLGRYFEQSPPLKARRQELADREWVRAARRFLRLLEREGHVPDRAAAALPEGGGPCYDLDAEVLNPDWFPPPPAG
jgi:Domain of unknown function DUF29